MVHEILSMTEFFVILDHFLPFYPLNNPKNQNFEKMKKIPGDIIILHVYQKLCSDDVRFLRYGVQWTDGRMDGQKKVTWVPHLKIHYKKNPVILN